jgi:hypothetical protein
MDELKTNDQKCEDIQKITDDLLSEVFEKYGTFFAFSDKQFKEQRKDGVTYVSLQSGMITPKDTADAMLKELDKAIDTAQAKDKELNSKEEIILRELINYESFYTCSTADATERLELYGYTADEVRQVYNDNFKEYVEKFN